MATLDWIILVLFLLSLFGIVWWVLKHKKDNTSDYFLSGRSETWLAVGAAIFAANIGSEHLVGLAGAGAESGMAMAHWEMQGWMILVLGWVFVPFYAHSKVFTMPEFLYKRFNKNTSSTLSVITLISYVLTKVSVTAFTGGIFLQSVIGIDFWYGAIGLVLLTGIFTVLGGMKGIMTISVIQTPILIVGSITILLLGLLKVGGGGLLHGWNEVVRYAGNNIHLYHVKGDPWYDKFPGVSVIFGASIIGFWYWCTDQHIVQRALAAKNLSHARKGTILAGFLKVLPVFMFLIPGMIAAALRAKGELLFTDNNEAYGSLVGALLPMGIKGIVIVGFIAALMTSLAAHFNSSATLFTIDFYKNYRPQASEHRLVWVGRLATITVVLLGLVWIPIMKGLGSVLYEYLQNVQSLIAPAIAAVFLLGVFNRKITPKAGEWGLLLGFLIGMFRLGLMVFDPGTHFDVVANKLVTDAALRYGIFKFVLDFNWLHFCIFLFFFTMAVMVVISLFTPRAGEEQLQGLTYFSQSPEQIAETRSSWTLVDVITSLVVVSICVAFYIYFW
jgi:solute:Na+ symporter, SSS family